MKQRKTSGTRRTAQRKRKKRTSLFILQLILVLGLLYAGIFHTPLFFVKTITVSGNTAADAQAVIDASGVYAGQHMMKVNRKKAAEQVEKLAFVSSAKVQYRWPDKINIAVTEGKIIANVRFSGGYASIDKNFKVLEISQTPRSFPVIEGVAVQKSVVGEKITIDETDKFDIILVYINILDKRELISRFKKMHMVGYNLWMEMDNGVKVKCGGTEGAEYKIAALMESVKNAPDITIGTFDITNPKRVVYSID